MKKLKFFVVMLFLFPMFSWAALIEFEGMGGAYNAADEWVNYAAGFVVDTDIVDSDPDPEVGYFSGALKSGFIIWEASRYELDIFATSGSGDIVTWDANLARGTLKFGGQFVNASGDSLHRSAVFRSYPGENLFDAGRSLHGLETIPLYFESDAELIIDGIGRYSSLDIRTVSTVPEPGSIILLLLGFLGIIGARLVKARYV
jgi:hypothetical protein